MRKDERRRDVGPDYFLASSASLMQKRHFRWSGRHSEDSLTDSVFSPHQHLPVWLQSLESHMVEDAVSQMLHGWFLW